MISLMGTMHPHLGKRVKPIIVTATGTSSLHGSAAEVTKQQQWACALKMEQPSHSQAGPQQQQGRQGAPGCDNIVSANNYSTLEKKVNETMFIPRPATFRWTHLAADLSIEATESNLSRTSTAVSGRIDTEIGTAKCTAQNEVPLVDCVVSVWHG